jgi:hypothetical protein
MPFMDLLISVPTIAGPVAREPGRRLAMGAQDGRWRAFRLAGIALDHGPRNQGGAFEAWPASHVAALMLAAAVAPLGSRGHSRLHGFNHRAAWTPDMVLAETGPRAGGSIRYVRYHGYWIDPRHASGRLRAARCWSSPRVARMCRLVTSRAAVVGGFPAGGLRRNTGACP